MEPLRPVASLPVRRPWWRRHLGNGLIVLYCLALLGVAGAIFRNCSEYFEIEACLETGGHWDIETETCTPR